MNATAKITVGTKHREQIVVTREMTVAHFHEEMPEVFGTPIMIYHMEVTASSTIEPFLPDGWVTVGVVVNIKHLAATPVGATVSLTAEVIAVDDQTITFKVEAHDGVDKIGEGLHVRAPVEMSRFMKRVQQKTERMKQ